jgi:sigma-E factor negative regulatory protein RseA
MNTTGSTQEQISALMDGELSDQQLDIAIAALRTPQGLAAWDDFHRVGDALRSDDLAISMSSDFSTRMFARLENEPAIVAPHTVARGPAAKRTTGESTRTPRGRFKRFAIPSMAAAAAATTVFFTTPQLMVAEQGDPEVIGPPIVKVADSMSAAVGPNAAAATIEVAARPNEDMAVAEPDAVVLRDPRIDEYLRAHQRFSPFMFSSAQYARSATFAGETGK